MIAKEFFDLFKKKQLATYIGAEDFVDKLSFLYTVVLLILSANVVAAKTYVLKPMSCYTGTPPSGTNFKDFLVNYCWVHGTIPFNSQNRTPFSHKQWERLDKTDRINYYQWVPFFLGLQSILFYLPRLIWKIFYGRNNVLNVEGILMSVTKAVHKKSDNDKQKLLEQTALRIREVLFHNHEFPQGRLERIWTHALRFFPLSRRLGTHIITTYFFIKCLFLANTIGQLYLMKAFLGFGKEHNVFTFGALLINHMIHGFNSEITRLFPRTGICHANVRQLGTRMLKVVSLCVLPVNMLTEKIYLFLWFWILFLAILTAFSLVIWWGRICYKKNRVDFIHKFLKMANVISKGEEGLLENFIEEILCYDGAFLIHMMTLNSGDLITSDVVCKLWQIYRKDQILNQKESPTAPESLDNNEKLCESFAMQDKPEMNIAPTMV